ncbi:MAG TPA: hypothetical protein VGK61_06385 [Planctomycetota bacterium]
MPLHRFYRGPILMILGPRSRVVFFAVIAALLAGDQLACAQEGRVSGLSPSKAALVAAPPPVRHREPLEESEFDRCMHQACLEACVDLRGFASPTPLDFIVGLPDLVVQAAGDTASSLCHDEGRFSVREESRRALLPRLIGAVDVGGMEHPFDELTEVLAAREVKYFAHFDETPLATIAYEEGLEDFDSSHFYHDQVKVITHALGKAYLGRYAAPFDQRLRRDAFDPSRWEPVDYVAGPCIMAGYLYLRGFNRSLALGDIECRFSLKPFGRINQHVGRSEDYLVSAASLEIGTGDFPLKVIYSAGVLKGSFATDFVGLGVNVPIALKAVRLASATPDSDR